VIRRPSVDYFVVGRRQKKAQKMRIHILHIARTDGPGRGMHYNYFIIMPPETVVIYFALSC
jgi:hypothetical protein